MYSTEMSLCLSFSMVGSKTGKKKKKKGFDPKITLVSTTRTHAMTMSEMSIIKEDKKVNILFPSVRATPVSHQ